MSYKKVDDEYKKRAQEEKKQEQNLVVSVLVSQEGQVVDVTTTRQVPVTIVQVVLSEALSVVNRGRLQQELKASKKVKK